MFFAFEWCSRICTAFGAKTNIRAQNSVVTNEPNSRTLSACAPQALRDLARDVAVPAAGLHGVADLEAQLPRHLALPVGGQGPLCWSRIRVGL